MFVMVMERILLGLALLAGYAVLVTVKPKRRCPRCSGNGSRASATAAPGRPAESAARPGGHSCPVPGSSIAGSCWPSTRRASSER